MPPKKPNKAEALDHLCEKLEKMTAKAEAMLERGKGERRYALTVSFCLSL
jgi:hypothetical protein